ncbi:uncharacterized protein LOC122089618 [Macadamia integrifolia]|uniref:uncharacterized protein LOC122089618 n=1 Tax=Macadamia integrifolia TaxID=60698 RepID=UPI001C4FEC14|nr:uncharacterized protein LOC122089618 [Macadamia integrifolia]
MAPYIFILCAQALNSILVNAESLGDIHGIRVKCRASPLMHLLYADDCLLFSKVDIVELSNLKQCLDLYYKASGQAINLSKSSITFSPNIHPHIHRYHRPGIGFAARNSLGDFLVAFAEQIAFTSPLITESIALRLTVRRATAEGWSSVIFESDSQ